MNSVVAVNGVDCSPDVIARRESAHAEEVARLRAENARLREALCTINLMCADGYYGPYSFTYAMEAKRLAAVALAADRKEGEK